jgi:2-C-methyl-D-erythritol 4-phosphate cytidylyltransferase/2-C-methyl-D-erythritol 2,4-cyclodiphosphate synthase
MPRLAVVLVAAGSSRRMGEDKLWIDLYGRPAWRWSLDLLLGLPAVERLALVVAAGSQVRFGSMLPPPMVDRCLQVAGGERRGDSVLAGLAALASAGFDDEAIVLVHDAARPALTVDLVQRLLDAAGERGGVVPVVPIADTLVRASGEPVDRDGLLAVQTPQLGRLGELRDSLVGGGSFSDEGSALRAAGIEVRNVAGEVANRKLTDPDDVSLLRAVLRGRVVPIDATSGERVGVGFDAHRLQGGRPLRLGGLDWAEAVRGLAGHSDGDVALHALIDALLGAAGLGDIGSRYPAEERWRGVDSAELLRDVLADIAAGGWRPGRVDLTIVAAEPRIAPRRDELRGRIAELLATSVDAVSVKATTSDGLGLSGGEGIAAYAAATLVRVA